ncbi:inositol monophosphatase family protein [Actinosynnema sp. NPDC053489]|uniref:inositol monophosphatase family protein n=1 Tax=Actinosynnema sp. NPDC053489 TaxID=3363916 RepID=UPI0037CB025E
MKRPLDQLAEIAQKAVGIGSYLIKTTRPQNVIEKTDRDTYTDVDTRIEREVRAYLIATTPEIGFTGEEEGRFDRAVDSEYAWVLDPIDGTSNFVHGVPLCGVSLALMWNNKAIVGAIAMPYLELIYSAIDGHGAYVNGQVITASKTAELSKAIVAIGDFALGEGAKKKNRQRIAVTAALAEEVERIRMFGSAAHDLAWLAEGRIDGVVILSNKIHDVAAGVLIAREAGAIVLDKSGGANNAQSTEVIAAAPNISNQLLTLVQSSLIRE